MRNDRLLCLLVAFAAAGLFGCNTSSPLPPHHASPQPSAYSHHDTLTLARLKDIREARAAIRQNLNHAQTPGYRAIRPVFVASRRTSPSLVLRRDHDTTGPVVTTGRALDLMIEGKGFFQSSHANGGVFYTRAGALYLNRDGELVLGSTKGPALTSGIFVPDDALSVSVSYDGSVRITNPDGTTTDVGQIELTIFISPEGLVEITPGQFVETSNSSPPLTGFPGEGAFGTILQGHLEQSNVDLYQETLELDRLRVWELALARSIDLDPAMLERPRPIETQTRNATMSHLDH
ncbi:MAG: flagellar hook basal-body protein [Planctomycetota bacterium]